MPLCTDDRRPLTAVRRQILLDLYRSTGVVTLAEARELLPVADATIRRDLAWLVRTTQAVRVYGGVVRPGPHLRRQCPGSAP